MSEKKHLDRFTFVFAILIQIKIIFANSTEECIGRIYLDKFSPSDKKEIVEVTIENFDFYTNLFSECYIHILNFQGIDFPNKDQLPLLVTKHFVVEHSDFGTRILPSEVERLLQSEIDSSNGHENNSLCDGRKTIATPKELVLQLDINIRYEFDSVQYLKDPSQQSSIFVLRDEAMKLSLFWKSKCVALFFLLPPKHDELESVFPYQFIAMYPPNIDRYNILIPLPSIEEANSTMDWSERAPYQSEQFFTIKTSVTMKREGWRLRYILNTEVIEARYYFDTFPERSNAIYKIPPNNRLELTRNMESAQFFLGLETVMRGKFSSRFFIFTQSSFLLDAGRYLSLKEVANIQNLLLQAEENKILQLGYIQEYTAELLDTDTVLIAIAAARSNTSFMDHETGMKLYDKVRVPSITTKEGWGLFPKKDYYSFLTCGGVEVGNASFNKYFSYIDAFCGLGLLVSLASFGAMDIFIRFVLKEKKGAVHLLKITAKFLVEQGDNELGLAQEAGQSPHIYKYFALGPFLMACLIIVNEYKGQTIESVIAPLELSGISTFMELVEKGFKIVTDLDPGEIENLLDGSTNMSDVMGRNAQAAIDFKQPCTDVEVGMFFMNMYLGRFQRLLEFSHDCSWVEERSPDKSLFNFTLERLFHKVELYEDYDKMLDSKKDFSDVLLSACDEKLALVGWSEELVKLERKMLMKDNKNEIKLISKGKFDHERNGSFLFSTSQQWELENILNPQFIQVLKGLNEFGFANKIREFDGLKDSFKLGAAMMRKEVNYKDVELKDNIKTVFLLYVTLVAGIVAPFACIEMRKELLQATKIWGYKSVFNFKKFLVFLFKRR